MDKEDQIKLKNSRILMIGAGGLGSPACLYLAAAGVGHIGIIDDDQVALSNLQRQILYSSNQVHTEKVFAAKNRLLSLNPMIQIETYGQRFTSKNALEMISSYDVIIDGTDRFSTRYLINDACVLAHKPLIYGAVFRFDGQASLFYPPEGPCYRCLYPKAPPEDAVPNCGEVGVLGVVPGIIGTLQATEALKTILQKGTSLLGRLLIFDALNMSFSTYDLKRRLDCLSCGENPSLAVT